MQKIIADIKMGNYAPLYLLHGNEPYFIDQISNYIEHNILNEGEQSFNQMVFYGKETKAQQVIDACSQFPMMASHRVIILKEAQEMRDIKLLENYIKSPSPTTILCICHKHKKLDTRTNFGKALKAKAIVFEAVKIYDNKVPAYVDNLIKAKKRIPSPQSSKLIAEYIGSDLSTLHNELEKLFLLVPEGEMIKEADVQKQIGISKEYNVFELQTAIGARDNLKVFRIAKNFQENPKKNPMIMVVSTLFRYFSKTWIVSQNSGVNDQALGKMIGVYNSFFVKEYRIAARNFNALQIENIFGILKEYDLKSKGVENRSYPENTLIIELVAKILA